ncbi:SH3 domain-containing protein [Sphingobacterium lumbrici]|uniref:SH3 domain-containing protein n=1 Tax=Sphingobacterium lumbrici TaxID=2559600 RepID=UPI00112A86B6|nr:SH3 domain-containing protein [Sphingobacterium lumbrici]
MIEDKYFKIKSSEQKGLNLGGLISEFEINDKHCDFTYFDIQMSGKAEIEKDNIYIDTGSELGVLSLSIIDKYTLEGKGWIAETFKRTEALMAKNKPAIDYYRTVKTVNVRFGPSTKYSKIESLSKGIRIKVVGIVDDWFEIEKDNYTGYIAKKMLSKD